MTDKRDYVRRRLKDDAGNHGCHWPGCTAPVPPAQWGCRRHWMMLPKALRDQIWLAFRPGQEISKTPSLAYLRVARETQRWIETRDRPWVRSLEYDL